MWNVNTELATLMKALKGLLNNQALMRVLKSNQCLFSMQPHFHWVLPATTSKENSHLCFPRYSNNHSKYGLEIKVLQVSRTTPGSVTSKKKQSNLSEFFLHGIWDTHVWFVWFFPSNYPRKKPLLPRLSINKDMDFTSSFATGWL